MYTAQKTFSVVDANGAVVPDIATAPSRIAYLSWLALGNTPTVVDNTAAAVTPPPATTPVATTSAKPWSVCLSDLMDAYYGAGLWTKRTGVGLGSDIQPALTAGCTSIKSNGGGRGEVIIPPGLWMMNSGVADTVLAGIKLVGYGSQASIICYNNNAGAAFTFSGSGGYTGGGMQGIGLMIEDGHPTSTAIGILMQGDASFQADQFMMSDLYVTALGNSYWATGLLAYGNTRVAPQGIRVAHIQNVQLFRCSSTGAFLSNIVQWTIENLGCYVGTGGGNNIYLAGGGAANTNSIQVYMTGISCVELNLTNCSYFDISGHVDHVTSGASATNGSIRAPGATVVGSLGFGVRLN